MRYAESFILGACGALLALILQIFIIPQSAIKTLSTTASTVPELSIIIIVIVAAACEELIRLTLIAQHALRRGIPDQWWISGAVFGVGFGGVELLLKNSFNDLSRTSLVLLASAFFVHILLSIFATRALPYFERFPFFLTLLFLIIFHSTFNLLMLYVVPLFMPFSV